MACWQSIVPQLALYHRKHPLALHIHLRCWTTHKSPWTIPLWWSAPTTKMLQAWHWAQRSDEPTTYSASARHRLLGFPNDEHKCKTQEPGQGAAYCLTRMMDCRKPSGAFKDNVHANLMVAGRKLVQTCTDDGYTRIDVQCGCYDCYC